MSTLTFSSQLLGWWDQCGRKDLPWQSNPTPYRVWISEIMLQQTQVKTVIPYYARFMDRFPDLQTLASAPLDDVLHHWTGLGYYARARNIHKAANMCLANFSGELPDNSEALVSLPGIGRSTAAAILSLAYQQRAAILDGNVKRVLARVFGVTDWPGQSQALETLWQISEAQTPTGRCDDYNQAMMDFGATHCTGSKPLCHDCLFSKQCFALTTDQVAAIPGKKPKKTVPTLAVCMAILADPNHRIYLEQRPNHGIWGGLFCFPEFSDTDALAQHFSQLPQAAVQELGQPFTHKFTHRTLVVQPVFLHIDAEMPTIDAEMGCWIKPDKALHTLGLPAPIKRLIETIKDTA